MDYKPTTLEKNYKHEMLTEVDLGVNIDLINPDTYAIDHNGKFSTIFIFCLKQIHPLLEKDYVILFHVLMTVNI